VVWIPQVVVRGLDAAGNRRSVDTAGSGKRFGYCRKLGEMWILQLVIIGLDTADIRRSVECGCCGRAKMFGCCG